LDWIHRGRNFGRLLLKRHNGCNEAVALADYGLDKLRIVGIVAEQVAELTDGGIDAVFGVDEDFARSEAIGNFAASDELTFPRREQDEQLHGLALNTQGAAVTEELERSAVEAELTELIDKAAQGTLLRGGIMTQSRRKRPDLKGFVRSPKLYLRLHPLFIARARIAVSFVGSRRYRPWRN
jgi:hypothetical protein